MLRPKRTLLSIVLVVILILGLSLAVYADGNRDRLRNCDNTVSSDCIRDRLRERDRDCDMVRDRLRLRICKDEVIEEIIVYEKLEEELNVPLMANNQELLRQREVARLRIQEMLKDLKEEVEQHKLLLEKHFNSRLQIQTRNLLQIRIGFLEEEIEIIESVIK